MRQMGDALGFMYGMYIIAGIYMIAIALRAAKSGEVSNALIWDRDRPIEKCRDREGFIGYICPRVVVCGIVMALSGVYSIASEMYSILPDIGIYSMIPLLAVFVFYTYVIRKAAEKFY